MSVMTLVSLLLLQTKYIFIHSKFIGRGNIPKINENLVQTESQIPACFEAPLEHLNIRLKNGLQEEKDFIFLTEEMWQIFSKYDHIEIKRFV